MVGPAAETLPGAPPPARAVRLRWSADDFVMCAGLVLLLLFLLVFIGVPLWALLSKGFQDKTGEYVGFANFLAYFRTGAPLDSLKHSLTVSALATAIVVPLAFVYAYALTRSCMALKGLFGALALIPILAPSLLPALSLVYIFGNQGFLKILLFGESVYGPIGIVIAQVFYCFPFAVMILVTALRIADGRLYEAADALGASRMRIFWTVTLPGAKYGLVSAAFVVFTLVITDFGIPKVIGGQYNVLSTDVYKQVIGQQNFEMGAVVGLVLLVPAILSFGVDRLVQRRQVAMLSARAVPLVPKSSPAFDRTMFAFCAIVAGLLLFVLLVAVWGSFVSFWPYNLSLSLKNYDFATHDDSGWRSYWHSLEMAAWTALAGTLVVFSGGWLIEKSKGFAVLKFPAHLLAMLPLAVPGLVLGLAYIFFFNAPWNPLNFLYGTLAILVLNSVAHFYTVGHLTSLTALKQIDPEFESVSASLKAPVLRTFARVTVPVCVPAILDIGIYFFVNAMTTVSAVIFLYSANTKLASIAVVSMDDTGATAAAAAMASLIFATSAAVRGLHGLLSRRLVARTQAWRRR